jgi:hypothetical protein
MDVQLNNPDRWVSETGRGPDEPIEDAIAGHFAELTETQDMLNSRYNELKGDRVKAIPGDEVEAYFREKSAAARRSPHGS